MLILSKTGLFNLKHEKDCGDATSWYEVQIRRECTVREFIDEVLSNDREWGEIYVRCIIGKNKWFDQPKCEYSHGILDRTNLSELPLDHKVVGGDANGGWGSMTYWLDLEGGYV